MVASRLRHRDQLRRCSRNPYAEREPLFRNQESLFRRRGACLFNHARYQCVTVAAAGRQRGFTVSSRNHLIIYVACLVAPYTTRGYSPYLSTPFLYADLD